MMNSEQDYYSILQVHPEASQEVIRAAYRALAQRYHPDSAGSVGTPKMVELNVAYEVLGDPERRAGYDQERSPGANGARTQGSTSTHTNGSTSTHTNGSTSTNGGTTRHASDPWWAGAAGPPPGRPSGSVLPFGRHKGWSLGEIARHDPGYLEWLERKPEGRPYLDEINQVLVKHGFRQSARRDQTRRRAFSRG